MEGQVAYCSVKAMRVSPTEIIRRLHWAIEDSLQFGWVSEIGFSFASESLLYGLHIASHFQTLFCQHRFGNLNTPSEVFAII